MIRLWLRSEDHAWGIPQALQHGLNRVFYNEDIDEQWNIAPQPRLNFKIYQTLGPVVVRSSVIETSLGQSMATNLRVQLRYFLAYFL